MIWLAPEGVASEKFATVREGLERILAVEPAEVVYTAKRRRVYRSVDAELGPVAVKEVRNPTLLRRLWFGYFARHRALRELAVGSAFARRGGRTPAFLGAALDRGPDGLRSIYLFLRWLDGCVTLTDYVRERGGRLDEPVLAALATTLVDSARLGLVHGRHSSENLLVRSEAPAVGNLPAASTDAPRPAVYVIDFAYSRLADGFDRDGFIGDVARIGRRLRLEDACSREVVAALFDRAARTAWADATEAARGRQAMLDELARIWPE